MYVLICQPTQQHKKNKIKLEIGNPISISAPKTIFRRKLLT